MKSSGYIRGYKILLIDVYIIIFPYDMLWFFMFSSSLFDLKHLQAFWIANLISEFNNPNLKSGYFRTVCVGEPSKSEQAFKYEAWLWTELVGYIGVGDGCWRWNLLITSLRCWWPIYLIEKITKITNKRSQHNDSVTDILNRSPTLSHQHNLDDN